MSRKAQQVSERVSQEVREENLGSLRGCLVDGDAGQRERERRVRRRALAISVGLQSTVLVAVVLIPLFGKPDRIALANAVPLPPFSPGRPAPARPQSPGQAVRHPQPCWTCPAAPISAQPVPEQFNPGNDEPPGLEPGGPAIPGALPIDNGQRTPRIPQQETEIHRPQVLRMTHIDPALLIHRVEPVYPALARQIHKEGRVELHAIIATDGTIKALQVASGDVLFYQSALAAVEQWRYRPTILNGQPVEIDTYITVIYTMQH
jgi:periplasmic protein TonB